MSVNNPKREGKMGWRNDGGVNRPMLREGMSDELTGVVTCLTSDASRNVAGAVVNVSCRQLMYQ